MNHTRHKTHTIRLSLMASALCSLVLFHACGDDDDAVGTGSLDVLIETEDLIVDGLQPGEDAENIRDGWAVNFDKYIVAVGEVELQLSTDENKVEKSDESYAVDLTTLPSGGLSLWSFEAIQAGRWEFSYSTVGAADGVTKHESVDQADFDAMVSNDWTYWIDGTLNADAGQSCPPASLAMPCDQTPNG